VFGDDVQASVQGIGTHGRYEATVTNSTDDGVFITCTVTGVRDYGAVGSDRFILAIAAGSATSLQGTMSLDDLTSEYEIKCVEDA
jgi:hypothetical protein